ncbi:MAG: hypothetical protein JSV52_03120 [Candidatus Zixiibacteriota bacterium]|nr:MAG: hypothetical protein JSV52_03120 [candidate division Zixibacteria bacterium]
MGTEQIVSVIVVVGTLLGIFGICAWVIKRHWIDKAWINESTRFIGRTIFEDLQNADEKERIQHVIYMEEDERDEDFGGDPPKPGEEEVEIDYKDGDDK